MNYKEKTKEELINELEKIKKENYELKNSELKYKEAEKAIKYKLSIEELALSIANHFINIDHLEVYHKIVWALKTIGEFVRADRCYLYIFSECEKKSIYSTYEWHREDVSSRYGKFLTIPVDDLSWIFEQFNNFKNICVADISYLPPEADKYKSILADSDVKSLLEIPIFLNENLFAFIGFHTVKKEKTWKEEEIKLLKTTGEILAKAQEQKESKQGLYSTISFLENNITDFTYRMIKTNDLLTREIEARKKAEEGLYYRLNLEGVVSTISAGFLGLRAEEVDGEITKALETIGKCLQVDYSFINVYSSDLKDADTIYTWHKEGYEEKNINLKKIFSQPSYWIMGELKKFEVFICSEIEKLPPEAEWEREIFLSSGVRTFLAVPMILGKRLIGSLFFLSCQKEKRWDVQDVKMLKLAGETFAHVLERKWGEENSKKRLNFEKTIAEVSTILHTELEDIDKALDRALQMLGEVSHACRTYIFIFKEESKAADNTNEWYAPGGISQKDNLQNLSIDRFPCWIEILKNGHFINVSDISSLPPEAQSEKEFIEPRGIKSILIFPIYVQNKLFGFIGFDNTKKAQAWSEEDVFLLKTASDIIGQAIGKKRMRDFIDFERKQLLSIFDNLDDMVYVIDLDTYEVVYANKKAEETFLEEGREKITCYKILHGRNTPCDSCKRNKILKNKGTLYRWEYYDKKKGKYYSITDRVIKWPDGRDVRFEYVIDITEKKKSEEEKEKLEVKLRKVQKMQAIGTLAGGIAHDFNNILASIIGYTDMAILDVKKNTLTHLYLDRVLKAGHRAKELIKQILTFTRQAEQEKQPLQISLLIKEVLLLLRASFPTTISIKQDIEAKSTLILADAIQIHQVIMNLCTNAFQAMQEKGGVLRVRLIDIDVVDDICPMGLEPGKYVKLVISDTGPGIGPDVLDRIFDPYFTTKGMGEGTGLGLAVVQGIVRGHKGEIRVESKPGKGTSFHIFFPRIEKITLKREEEAKPLLKGTEKLLVVEDEKDLLEMLEHILVHLGYEVHSVMSAREALEAFSKEPDSFDLVITDQTMPQMTGDELAGEILKIKPHIPVILCSGFSETVNREKARAIGIKEFIMKPVNVKTLSRIIREVLE